MIETREAWRSWVTPKALRTSPVHRWYAFPHSFTGELVDALIREWELTPKDRILDPFVGAGTTVLAAKMKGVPAAGYDLSPLATFVTRVKTRDYNINRLEDLWARLQPTIRPGENRKVRGEYDDLVYQALPDGILATFEGIDCAIRNVAMHAKYRDFFRLALLAIIPKYSRAVATGGWLKWITNRAKRTGIFGSFAKRVDMMIGDLQATDIPRGALWKVARADARTLPDHNGQYAAVITSPPYPNRHDYTRVFGVELLYGFLNWTQTRRVRYQSIHSHPESRPRRPCYDDYSPPRGLKSTLRKMEYADLDTKILRMLEGYFIDMHLCLRECQRVVKTGGRIAFVVGNAQYRGYPVPVDEYLVGIGQSLGLSLDRVMAVRFRGNSAQQMGAFGRHPSRESIVVFRKP